ncbi:MAG: peptidoglycan hydrolase-like protein with peptidoglycan-binding domain [Clostridium sp.]
MNKKLKMLTCSLAAIFTLTIAVNSPKLGPFSVDAVSAATGEAPVAPAKPATPSKPNTPSSSSNSGTHYTSSTNNMSTSFTRLLQFNSIGGDVKLLQSRLSSYGYRLNADGIFGNSTLVAVKDFQSKHDLTVDGLAGTATLARLTPKIVVKTTITSTLKSGSNGIEVKILQTRLSSYGYRLYGDGIFGNSTLVAVKDFQSKHVLIADGIVGPATITKLFAIIAVTPVTPTKPVTPPVVTPPVVVTPPDVVTSASLVDNAAGVEEAISKDGTWIIAILNDVTTDKDLVLQGKLTKPDKSVPPVQVATGRKIALYAQDDKHVTTDTFTLTAPKLTIKSTDSTIQKGTFKGDLYVSAQDFNLKTATIVGDVYVSETGFNMTEGSKIEGNVYFTNQQAKDSFVMDDTSSVTGTQTLKVAIPEKTTIKVGRAESAAHGTKCFTVAVVAMAGDKIVAASIDDYQFMSKDVATGVPNSDLDFGKNYADATIQLASKRTNATYYSEHMKEAGGATLPLDTNYNAVQAFAVGKTIAQLEAIIKTNPIDPKVDVVTSATLADTNGYLSAIVAAAKTAKENSPIQVEVSALNSLKIGRVEAAAHGTKCFTVAVVAMAGDKIVAASIDDYQFMSKDVATGVPNSNLDFGKNYADATIQLASKRTNATYYSEHMKEAGGATLPLDTNYNAVQAFAVGKTVTELESAIKANGTDPKVDAVTSATLADTNGYLNAILSAAKAAK